VAVVIDREESHLRALRALAALRGKRVLEVGCGNGRITRGIVEDGASVFAFDPDAGEVEEARTAMLPRFEEQVSFTAARAEELEIPRASFDIVLFSWSL
jgi:ubiquinone/menaquinone biosynthesis C-methylase UbiE